MLHLLHFCVSAGNIRNIIFEYQSKRTVAYFMQIMRPATDAAYELRFYDVPVAYLFCIHGLCVAYMLRCCGKSFLCTVFLYGLGLVPVFFVLVKIHSKRTPSHCVSCNQAANVLFTCCVPLDRTV